MLTHVDEVLHSSNSANVFWIVGVPKAKENEWRVSALREINAISADAKQHEVSTFEYQQTIEILERIHSKKWDKYNVTISPLGSKLQNIGVAIFCYLHPEVRLLFASPAKYNSEEWSHGVGPKWQIEFGSMVQLRKNLDKLGAIEILNR